MLEHEIALYLQSEKVRYVKNVNYDPIASSVTLDIPIDILRDKASEDFISKRKVLALISSLKKVFPLHFEVNYFLDELLRSIKTYVENQILKKFKGSVDSIDVSFLQGNIAVVFVSGKDFTEETRLSLNQLISTLLENQNISCQAIDIDQSSHKDLGNMELLRILKTLSPATIEQICSYLKSEGSTSSGLSRSISSKLDGLRKKEFLVRNPSGSYALTSYALELVPHRANRSSSDIGRILNLARRKW